MYNLYIHEKRILENTKKQSDSFLNEKIMKKRQEKIQKLTNNYNNRMKNFIFSMCENPIILKNNDKEKNNVHTMRNFKFKEIITDKQRLNEIESYKKKLNSYEQRRKSIEKKRNIKKIKNHTNYVIIQPQMRFNNRTKLETIIDKLKKDDIINVETLNATLLEHIKNLKFTAVKKVKEFYQLLDKNDLEDREMQKIIQNISDVEQSELNNKYSLEDYLQWKYNDIILSFQKKATNNNENITTNRIIKDIENNSNNNSSIKNDYKVLQKDDFKTHFKGASQFIELMDLEDRNKKIKKYILQKKRAMSALKLRNKNNTDFNIFKRLKDIKNPRNKKNKKAQKLIRSLSVFNLHYHDKKNTNLLNKFDITDFSLNNLNEGFKKKKLMMKESMSNEISKSISNGYMQKYNPIDLNSVSSIVNLPKNIIIQNYDDLSDIKSNEELKQKFTLLSNELEQERRKINDEKYKKFVKRFSRSIFGFKMKDKVTEMNAENKQDYIMIDKDIYPKKDIKKIANKIFLKCNYYNKIKSKI